MSLDTNDLVAIRDVFNEAFEELIEPRFEDIDKRFDKLEGRMDNIEGRMDKQEQATTDLRAEMRSGFASVNKRIDDLSTELHGKLQALEDDIKDIYKMLATMEKGSVTDRAFRKLNLQERLFVLNSELLAAAKEAGVTLPR